MILTSAGHDQNVMLCGHGTKQDLLAEEPPKARMATGFRDYHKLFSSITETRYVPCFHLCIFIPASIVNQAKVNSSLAVLM